MARPGEASWSHTGRYNPREEFTYTNTSDYPKQSDRALHRCLYDSKSVKNDCTNNCLAFTCNIMARPVEASRNHTGRYNPREEFTYTNTADYPKQSDRALHRCLYDGKSVKNDCTNNCLAFTYNIMARPVEASRNHTGRYNPREEFPCTNTAVYPKQSD